MKYNESKPFSSGTEYEVFLYNWCERCTHYKLRDDGFPEFPENGGCPVLDTMEYARLDINVFPRKEIIEEQDEKGTIVYYHKLTMIKKKKKSKKK